MGYYWLMSVHGYVVSSIRTVHPLMKKLRTKSYTLRDGQVVTCRSVANKIGVSESAARNRLNRSDDPKRIFAPYSPSNGGQPKKDKLPKSATVLPIDDEMWKLCMRVLNKKHD